MHPVGPQPPSVYWVRRVVVIVVLLAILGLLIWFLGGRGGGDGASAGPGPTTSPSPSVSDSPDASPSPSESKSKSPKPTKSESASASSTAPVACKDSAISVTASTDAASYPVGSTPRLRMRITNSSDTACKRDVGAPANELLINVEGTQFWSSDDCNPGGDPDVVVLEPKQSYSVTYTWMGNQSKQGCPSGLPAAGAGTYELVGRNGDVRSEPQSFSLTGN